MSHTPPQACRPEAWQHMKSQLDRLDTIDGLINGAVAIAMHEDPSLNPNFVISQLDFYARTIHERMKSDQPMAKLAHLHQLLFDEERFVGNVTNYYHPHNSYLQHVIRKKTGLPIAVSLVYHFVAYRIGLTTHGIGAPGHFIIEVEINDKSIWIDPFGGGRELSLDEAHQMVEQLTGELLPNDRSILPRVSHQLWLARMCTNLQNVFAHLGHQLNLGAMVELKQLLAKVEG